MAETAKNLVKLRLLTRREHFEYLYNQVSESKNALRNANSEESVTTALDNLETLIRTGSEDENLLAVRHYFSGIAGMLHSVNLHDSTRFDLDEVLSKMLVRLRNLIAEEVQKENAEKLRTLFLELAKHADELVKVIDVSKIFN